MEIESREETVTRKYLIIENKEFSAPLFLDVLEDLELTSAYGRMLGGASGQDKDILDFLLERDIVGKTASGAYFCRDKDARKEMSDELLEVYYD